MGILAPGAGALPPLFQITDNDHSGYVCVAVYTLLTLMILLVATRVFTRWYVLKFIKSDDFSLMIAAVRTTGPLANETIRFSSTNRSSV